MVDEQQKVAESRPGVLGKLGLTAGVGDAAMSSLATFLGGLVAANILGDSELGVYAVFFTAFNFGQVIANNLVYIPAEVTAVAWPTELRTRVLTQSIPLGILPSVVGALAIGTASLVAAQISTADVVLPLTVTAALTTFLWPTQDHIRRMLHIADRSFAAAGVSAAHLATTALAIWVLIVVDVRSEWVPFGALAIANLISLLIGLALAMPKRRSQPSPEHLRLRSLTRSGRWLMVGVGIPTLTAFGSASIITFTAGPEVLGWAEAARIVAHPILVLGTGLGYVMGPRIMRGAIARDAAVSRHNHRRFSGFLVAASAAYALIVGIDWAGNPMSFLVPDAYVVEWLVVATIAANVFMAAVVLVLQELTAAQRTKTIAVVSAISAPLQLLGAATANVTQAFARPISLIIGNGARLYGTSRAISQIYTSDDPQVNTQATDPARR